MNMSNRAKYDQCFKEAFELDEDANLKELKYMSIEEWDSIGHMSLMSELEEAFEIEIKTEDLIRFESYQQGPDILKVYAVELD